MALGGGTFITQNKVLPGAYFNFISKLTASATLGTRGVVGVALDLDWGEDGKIIDVSLEDFQKNAFSILGYSYDHEKLWALRELFCHATKLHIYKLTSGGDKAANAYAKAKCGGVRGNDLKVVISSNLDNEGMFDVTLYLGTKKVDTQTVSKASELVDNAYVEWIKSANLTATAGTPLSGGTNGTSDADGHQAFLDKLESYTDTNVIAYAGENDAIKKLYKAYAERMRNEVGVKMQAVVYNLKADSYSVVNIKNSADIVYWVAGVVAGTAVNKSADNMAYDGELEVNTDYKQSELKECIKNGEFVLHKVNNDVCVLMDINSFTSFTEEEGDLFQTNQTIRVIDEIATSIATVFYGKYAGKIPNNKAGRTSLWNDIVKVLEELNEIGAIEDFIDKTVAVEQGDTKKSVVVEAEIIVVNAMTHLYMTTTLS